MFNAADAESSPPETALIDLLCDSQLRQSLSTVAPCRMGRLWGYTWGDWVPLFDVIKIQLGVTEVVFTKSLGVGLLLKPRAYVYTISFSCFEYT